MKSVSSESTRNGVLVAAPEEGTGLKGRGGGGAGGGVRLPVAGVSKSLAGATPVGLKYWSTR